MRRFLVIAALIACESRAPHAAHAQCPPSQVVMYNEVLPPIFVAVFDTVMFGGGWGCDFDLTQGRVHTFQGGSMAITSTRGVDAFDIAGVAAGTPVTLTARLVSDGTICCYYPSGTGILEMTLVHGGDVSTVGYEHQGEPGTPHAIHDERTLTLTIMAGTPEVISYEVLGHRSPGGAQATDVTGILSFQGLPAGARIVSCHGYSQDPTPALSTTWGQLKSLYR